MFDDGSGELGVEFEFFGNIEELDRRIDGVVILDTHQRFVLDDVLLSIRDRLEEDHDPVFLEGFFDELFPLQIVLVGLVVVTGVVIGLVGLLDLFGPLECHGCFFEECFAAVGNADGDIDLDRKTVRGDVDGMVGGVADEFGCDLFTQVGVGTLRLKQSERVPTGSVSRKAVPVGIALDDRCKVDEDLVAYLFSVQGIVRPEGVDVDQHQCRVGCDADLFHEFVAVGELCQGIGVELPLEFDIFLSNLLGFLFDFLGKRIVHLDQRLPE